MNKNRVNVLKGLGVFNATLLALKSSLDINLSKSVFSSINSFKILASQEFIPYSGVSNLFMYSLILLGGAAVMFDKKFKKSKTKK